MTVKIANPVYVPTAGYCMLGFYPGFSVGTTGTGTMHTVISSLENTWNNNIECLSIGLPNSLGDVTGFINNVQGCPQHIVATLPLSPMANLGGSLTWLLNDPANPGHGKYDALYLDMATKLVAAGLNGDKLTIRLGWEWDGNWSWGDRGVDPANGQTNLANGTYKAAFRRVVGIFRGAGFTGRFDCNGLAPSAQNLSTFNAHWPGFDFGTNLASGGGAQIMGIDFYSSIANAAFYSFDNTTANPNLSSVFNPAGIYRYGYKKSDYASVWTGEAKPRLDACSAWCRANGVLMGMGEFGQIINPQDRFASNDNSVYWPSMKAWLVANSDVCVYACIFNQTLLNSDGTIHEDDADLFLGGNKGTFAATAYTGDTISTSYVLGTGGVDNATNGPSGTWQWTPSKNRAIGMPLYRSLFQAGDFVHALPAPTFTYHHRIENFPAAKTKLAQVWTAPVATTAWVNPPAVPISVTATRSSDLASIGMLWSPPTADGGGAITGYVVTRDGVDLNGDGPYTATLPATARSAQFFLLQPGSSYTVTVAAINSAGTGTPVSLTVAGGTAPITPVGVVTVSDLTATSATFSWDPVPGATSYQVDVATGNLAVSGDFFVDVWDDVWGATAIPTGVDHSTGFADAFTDVWDDVWGVGAPPPPPLPGAASIVTTDVSATISSLVATTAYVVRVTAMNAQGSAAASTPVEFLTLAAGASDPVLPPVTVSARPAPVFAAFPVGASYRPLNFGASEANND